MAGLITPLAVLASDMVASGVRTVLPELTGGLGTEAAVGGAVDGVVLGAAAWRLDVGAALLSPERQFAKPSEKMTSPTKISAIAGHGTRPFFAVPTAELDVGGPSIVPKNISPKPSVPNVLR